MNQKSLKKIYVKNYKNLYQIYINQIKKMIKNLNIKNKYKILEAEKVIFKAKKKL